MVLGTRLLLGAALLAVLATGCGGKGEPPAPGVSFLDYSPKPFSKDMTEMTIRFTTTGAAGDALSDRGYFVWVFTGKDHRDEDCYPEFSSNEGIVGEPGMTYVQVIQMTASNTDRDNPGPDPHACTGHAQIVVWTGDNGGCCPPRKVMRRLSFRILPPTESYGTIPIHEATAAWRASLEADFETVVAVECYRVDPNYFECGSDLKASDGSVFTQDGSVLCEPTCVGHVGVGRGAYDD